MRLRNLVTRLAGLLLAFLALPGCHVLQRDRPVTVLVRDAETKAPIADAEVQVSSVSGRLPKITAASTATDGIAHLKVNPSAEIGYRVEVDAKGYFSEEREVSIEDFQPTTPALVVEMFAGPRPTIELIVPTSFRGVLRAEVRSRADAAYPPGQRAFRYTVPANGVVEALGPPVFQHGLAPDIHAVYADGKPLPREAKDDEIALRWVRNEGDDQVFFVGNRANWADYCKSLEKYEPHGGSGGGKGKGGGGRRGGGGGGRHGGGMGRGMGGPSSMGNPGGPDNSGGN